jgi:membrane protein DedA with SNARE-associated domain
VVGLFGVLLGDAIIFFLGRRFGKRAFRLPLLRTIFTRPRIEAAELRLRTNGPFVCFIARFLPGMKTAAFAMSGALGVRPIIFLLLDGAAALISVPLWIYVGYKVGHWVEHDYSSAVREAQRFEHVVLIAVASTIFIYLGFRGYIRHRRRKAAVIAP